MSNDNIRELGSALRGLADWYKTAHGDLRRFGTFPFSRLTLAAVVLAEDKPEAELREFVARYIGEDLDKLLAWRDSVPAERWQSAALQSFPAFPLETVREAQRLTRLLSHAYPLMIEVGGYALEVEEGAITSDLFYDGTGKYCEGLRDAIESLVLAHHMAGVDIADPGYKEGLATAVESAANHD